MRVHVALLNFKFFILLSKTNLILIKKQNLKFFFKAEVDKILFEIDNK